MKLPTEKPEPPTTPKLNTGGDYVDRLVGHPSFTPRVNSAIGNPGYIFIEECREIERELIKCRASLGAIHYHASRGSADKVVLYCILKSIKEEAETCVPELKNISLPNTLISETQRKASDANG